MPHDRGRLTLAAFLILAWAGPASAWQSQGTPVAVSLGNHIAPHVVPDGAGGAIVVWTSMIQGNSVLLKLGLSQHLTSRGLVEANWPTSGQPVFAGDSVLNTASAATDDRGGAVVVWITTSTPGEAVHARGVSPDGSISDGSVIAERGIVSPLVMARRDGATNFVAWQQLDYPSPPQWKLIALDRDGNLAPGWPVEGAAFGDSLWEEQPVALVPGPDGSAYLLAYHSGPDPYELVLYRADSTGIAAGWPASGVAVRERHLGPYQTGPEASLVGDGNGVILVYQTGWEDSPDQLPHVFAQRYDASGALSPGWPAEGRSVVTVPGSQTFPVAIADGEGGAFVAYQGGADPKGGADPNWGLFVQRISVTGDIASGWAPTGTSVCQTGGDAGLALDGAGGLFVAWADNRVGLDIYSHRLLMNGSPAPGWAPGGSPVCTAPGWQYSPQLVQTAPGQAIVAWTDWRSGHEDVYASRIDASGFIGDPASQPLSMRAPYPNPTRARASISFDLAKEARVNVEVLDLSGRVVRNLDKSFQAFGRHNLTWDTTDDDGRQVPNGIYFVQVRAPGLKSSQRIAVVR